MTPMGTRLVRRVLTVVAAMMIVAGVIAMHSSWPAMHRWPNLGGPLLRRHRTRW